MRDVSVDQFADELRDALLDKGVDLPRGKVLILTRRFFQHIEQFLEKKSEDQIFIYNRDIILIFTPPDVKRLCDEFASGHGVSYDWLLRRKKLAPSARYYLRKRMKDTTE